MCPQCACIMGCIVTQVAFVRFFSSVYSQMYPQMACVRGGMFTLVAFVSRPFIIKVFFAMINIHTFLQFDTPSFAASVQLIEKQKSDFKKKTLKTSYSDKI